MKTFALLAVANASVVHYRYKDVIDLAQRYWESNGEEFDATKYLAYGCHCMLLGDRIWFLTFFKILDLSMCNLLNSKFIKIKFTNFKIYQFQIYKFFKFIRTLETDLKPLKKTNWQGRARGSTG